MNSMNDRKWSEVNEIVGVYELFADFIGNFDGNFDLRIPLPSTHTHPNVDKVSWHIRQTPRPPFFSLRKISVSS